MGDVRAAVEVDSTEVKSAKAAEKLQSLWRSKQVREAVEAGIAEHVAAPSIAISKQMQREMLPHNDAGELLCYALGAPIWGEGPAGTEWEIHRNKILLAVGCLEVSELPGTWMRVVGEFKMRIFTCVDDLLEVAR